MPRPTSTAPSANSAAPARTARRCRATTMVSPSSTWAKLAPGGCSGSGAHRSDERIDVAIGSVQVALGVDDEGERLLGLGLDAEAREERAVEIADEMPAIDGGGRRVDAACL